MVVVAPDFQPWDLGTYLCRLLEQRGLSCARLAYQGLPAPALDAALRALRRPVLGLNLDPVQPETLQAMPVFKALWHVDCCSPEVPPGLAAQLPHLDCVFTTAAGMVAAYQARTSAPVHWLMEGVWLPGYRNREPDAAARAFYGGDVAFVGNLLYPGADGSLQRDRLDLLGRVAERHSLKVWGSQGRPESHAAWSGRAPLIPLPVYHGDLVAVCRSSAVVLGLNRTQAVDRYFSNRTFLTLASGGFHLTAYVPGLETLFENHGHLVWFHHPNECLELLAHYLARPQQRERIARAGQARVRSRYGMNRQAGALLKALRTAGFSSAPGDPTSAGNPPGGGPIDSARAPESAPGATRHRTG